MPIDINNLSSVKHCSLDCYRPSGLTNIGESPIAIRSLNHEGVIHLAVQSCRRISCLLVSQCSQSRDRHSGTSGNGALQAFYVGSREESHVCVSLGAKRRGPSSPKFKTRLYLGDQIWFKERVTAQHVVHH